MRPSNSNLWYYFNPSEPPVPSPQPTRPSTMSATVVSAPGKVLLAGGYLILDPKYSGLVVSTSSRFYSVVSPASTPGVITVNSPQFTNAVWKYSVSSSSRIEAVYVTGRVLRAHTLTGPLQPIVHRRQQVRPPCVATYPGPCHRFERPRGHRYSIKDRPRDSHPWEQRFLFTGDYGTSMASPGPRGC